MIWNPLEKPFHPNIYVVDNTVGKFGLESRKLPGRNYHLKVARRKLWTVPHLHRKTPFERFSLALFTFNFHVRNVHYKSFVLFFATSLLRYTSFSSNRLFLFFLDFILSVVTYPSKETWNEIQTPHFFSPSRNTWLFIIFNLLRQLSIHSPSMPYKSRSLPFSFPISSFKRFFTVAQVLLLRRLGSVDFYPRDNPKFKLSIIMFIPIWSYLAHSLFHDIILRRVLSCDAQFFSAYVLFPSSFEYFMKALRREMGDL